MDGVSVWIARDSDGSLVMYHSQPTYNETMGDWEPTGDDPTVEFVELGSMKWPEIEPACCVKFEQAIHYREKFVCPSCKGTGTVYVDFEHPQWVRCGCAGVASQ